MPTSTLHNVRFAGMATCVPKRVVSNLTDCRPQIRSERERLVRNIGIETRRMAGVAVLFRPGLRCNRSTARKLQGSVTRSMH